MDSTLKEEIIDKLKQILDSINVIRERSVEFHSVSDFLRTSWGVTVMDSCVMRLQVIGETIKSIEDKTHGTLLGRYPQIPWLKVIGLRNIISHEYANIDYDIIWNVINKHLTPLKEVVEQLIEDLSYQWIIY